MSRPISRDKFVCSPERVKFRHNAAHSPNINRSRVEGAEVNLFSSVKVTIASPSEQDLGRPVPPRADVIRVRGPRANFPREAEVCDLDEVRSGAQQVLGLHVPVEVAVLVHEGESLEDLEHHVPDGILREQLVPVVISLLHHLVEVLLHIFKHKVKSVILTDNL